MTVFQPTLDFSQKLPPAAQEKIADGMQRADENASDPWKVAFDGCLFAVARRKEELCSDDVLEEMERLGHKPETHNLAAIGPAMSRAAKRGVLSHTDRVKRSERPLKHGNRQNIWVSNYWSPE